ncbi:flavin-containing monooxygenase [Streptomyces sp. NPDC002577]
MSDTPAALGGTGFDPEAIRRKYQEESEKRRSKKSAGSRPVAQSTVLSVEDPFVETGVEREPLRDEVDVVVVGGGHTGIITGAYLSKAGVPRVRLIEKGAGFGGVWYWNRYPGIRCDVDAYSYMPMLEETGVMPTEKYVQGDEIRANAQLLAEKFGLDKDACMQTQVTGMRWDEETERWIVTTDRGDEMRAKFVCLGSGTLDNPSIPDVPGLDEYQGHVFHSSRWDYGYTGGSERGGLVKLAGKRVAVIGTAASSIQFIPELGKYAEQVFVVQRTPVVVIPRNNHATDPVWFRDQKPGWQKERVENLTAIAQPAPGSTPPAQDILNDSLTGLSKMMTGASPEVAALLEGTEPADLAERILFGNYAAMEKIRADMASIVDDPDTAEKLKPYYNLGCNRPQFSDTYLQAYNRPDVTLLDTEGRGLEGLTEKGILVDGVEFEADCVIFGTGFAMNAGHFPVAGRGGELLSEHWADGMRSLHGLLAAGFPNLFVVGGIPQATHAINFTHQLYDQGEHVATIVRRVLDGGFATFEVRPEAEERWAQQLKQAAAGMPRPDFNCAPNPQTDLIHSGYPGGPLAYAQACREWLQDGFERDLVVERPAEPAKS